MTEKKGKAEGIDVKALLAGDDAFIRAGVRAALQEVLEAEMTEALSADCPPGDRQRRSRASGRRTGWDIAPATTAGR